MKEIYFAHSYLKLERQEFTTIRGVSWESKPGRRLQIKRAGCDPFNVEVVKCERVVLKTIPLAVLQADMAARTWAPYDVVEAVRFLNSFRRSFMPKLTADSEVALLTLRKTP